MNQAGAFPFFPDFAESSWFVTGAMTMVSWFAADCMVFALAKSGFAGMFVPMFYPASLGFVAVFAALSTSP